MPKSKAQKYRESRHWKDKRREAIAHFKVCCECATPESKPWYVWHKNQEAYYHETMDDLEMLCERCNGDRVERMGIRVAGRSRERAKEALEAPVVVRPSRKCLAASYVHMDDSGKFVAVPF